MSAFLACLGILNLVLAFKGWRDKPPVYVATSAGVGTVAIATAWGIA